MLLRVLFTALVVLGLFVPPSAGDEPAPWSIAILTVTDTRSEIPVCHCPGIQFSGPALRGWVYKSARAWAAPSLILDGGDFSASPDDTLLEPRDALNREVMGLLHYDAVGVGERDLALGVERLGRTARSVPLVCANLRGLSEIPPLRWVTAGNRRIAVTGYLDPLLVGADADGAPAGFEDDSIRVVEPLPALREVLTPARKDADLVVVIAHSPWLSVTQLAADLEGVDVIVLGHPSEDTRILEHAGDIPALAPPPLGHDLVQVTMTRDPDGELVDVRPRVWNLRDVRKGDSRIEELTRAFEDRWAGR